MKRSPISLRRILFLTVIGFVAILHASTGIGQITAFTYQGRLTDNGAPATGSYDFQFTLRDAVTAGNSVGSPVTTTPVAVAEGLFTVTLDFGSGVFDGTARWLEIGVRPHGSSELYTTLVPRQPVTATPYALFAPNAAVAGSVSSGAIGNAQLAANAIEASNIASGQVVKNLNGLQDSVVLAAGSNVSLATNGNTLSISAVTGSGGVAGWQGVTGTSQQAAANTGYLVTGADQASITLPSSLAVGDVVRVSGAGAGGWKIVENPGQAILNWNGEFGAEWTARESTRNWQAVASSDDGAKLVAVSHLGSGAILTSVDGGANWTHRMNGSWRAVASSANGGQLVAALWGTGLYTSSDSGASWNARGGPGACIALASSADGTKLVAGGWYGRIYTSTDSGNTWTQREDNRMWDSVASSADGSKLVATAYTDVGWPGGIFTSSDSGTNWIARETSKVWYAVASSADGNKLVAVAYPGGIFTSDDSGTNWISRKTDPCVAVASSADGAHLIALGGQIHTSSDSGVTWTSRPNLNSLRYVASSADGSRMVAALEDGQIYTSVPGTKVAPGSLAGQQDSAIELQYIGDNQFRILNHEGSVSGINRITAAKFTGAFAGDGSSLTNLNADHLTLGTIADARLSANVALLNANQTFSGVNSFSNPGNSFAGTGAGLTALDASNLASGMVADARLSANVALLDSSPSFTGAIEGRKFAGSAAALTNLSIGALVELVPTPVVAWGNNNQGQTDIPPSLSDIVAISSGDTHGLALKDDGTVEAWGDNNYGKATVPTGLSQVVAIAAGNYHSLALRRDGTITAWGRPEQSAVPPGLNNVIAIAVGTYHSLALKKDGTVVSWGNLQSGLEVPPGLANVTAISAGPGNSMALKSDHTVVVWGNNDFGQANVPAGVNDVVAIASAYHSLALKSDGTVRAWGDNRSGEADPPAGLSNVAAIAAGQGHSLALKKDGTVVAWGWNSSGQSDVPAGLSNVAAIAASYGHSMALRQNAIPAPVARLDQDNTFNGNISVNGVIAGNGSSLTTLNAGNLTSGTVSDARLSANVALLNGNQTFTGANIFNNASGTFSGSGAGLTDLNASSLASGTLSAARLSLDVASAVSAANAATSANVPNSIVKRDVRGNFSFSAWQVVDETTQQAQPNTGYLLVNDALVTVTLPTAPNLGDTVRVSGVGAGGWKIEQSGAQSILAGNLPPGNVGALWTPRASSQDWFSIASSADGTKLVAVAYGGQIYTSADSGMTWTPRTSEAQDWRCVASSADGKKLVAAVGGPYGSGQTGQIYTSPDGGMNWTIRYVTAVWQSVASSADGKNLVAIGGAGIHTSSDSGTTWINRYPFDYNWRSVASSADGTKLIAAAYDDELYTSSDSGVNWTARSAGVNRNWQSVASSADGSTLFATVGSGGGNIWVSNDAGETWSARGENQQWWSIACSADGTKVTAAVMGGYIHRSTDSGETWTARNSGSQLWRSVASSADGNKLVAAAQGNQIYTSTFIPSSTAGPAGYLLGNQHSAIELQYVGDFKFIPLSYVGKISTY